MSIDKTPKNVPNQCNYNSQNLKDDVVNFLKSHCLISDYVLGNVVHFVDKYATSLAVDTVKSPNKKADSPLIHVYYLGTVEGKILKVSSFDPSVVISEWKLSESGDIFTDIKVNSNTQQLYALTDNLVYQISLNQCDHHKLCTTCMSDPYCGWSMSKNACQDAASSKSLIALDESVCSRLLPSRQESAVKIVNLDYGAHVELECNTASKNYEYLFDFIEWRKDQQVCESFISVKIKISNKRFSYCFDHVFSFKIFFSIFYDYVTVGEILCVKKSYGIDFSKLYDFKSHLILNLTIFSLKKFSCNLRGDQVIFSYFNFIDQKSIF